MKVQTIANCGNHKYKSGQKGELIEFISDRSHRCFFIRAIVLLDDGTFILPILGHIKKIVD